MMVIAWNGDVGLCCEDNFIEQKMGNVLDSNLREIWYGKRFRKVREFHHCGSYHRVPLCKDCDVWSADTIEFTNQKVFSKK